MFNVQCNIECTTSFEEVEIPLAEVLLAMVVAFHHYHGCSPSVFSQHP